MSFLDNLSGYSDWHYVILFVLSFLSVWALTPFMIKIAFFTNFMDNPEARNMHKKETPLLGGAAVFTGFLTFALLGFFLLPHTVRFPGFTSMQMPYLGFLGGGFIIFLTGIVDDRLGMKPMPKMAGQILACLCFILSYQFTYHDFLDSFAPAWITLPVLMLWMIGLINALNFLDNMDGIISGMSAILALGFFVFSRFLMTGQLSPVAAFVGIMSVVFAGSVLGFLPHNFRPAKIFLGDAGSMFIGYFLAGMGFLVGRLFSIRGGSDVYYLLPVILLGYAIFDITLVSVTRKLEGRRITQGGKDHSTHRLQTLTGSVPLTALIVYGINLLLVVICTIAFQVRSIPVTLTFFAATTLTFILFGVRLDRVPIVVPDNQRKKGKKA